MRWTIALIAWVSVSCVGTETGNPITTEGSTTDSMTAALVETPGAPVIDEVWISVEGTRAILGADCDHLGPLVGGASGNLLDMLELAAPHEPESCGVHLATTPAPAVGPESFAGATGLVRGRRADGVPFELRTTSMSAISVEGMPGVDLRQAHVLSFDVARWLMGLDLSGAPDADGVVRVQNAEFDMRWPHAASLFADLDGDGRLDDAERARPPVASSHR